MTVTSGLIAFREPVVLVMRKPRYSTLVIVDSYPPPSG
jgi:hypothetical protein